MVKYFIPENVEYDGDMFEDIKAAIPNKPFMTCGNTIEFQFVPTTQEKSALRSLLVKFKPKNSTDIMTL